MVFRIESLRAAKFAAQNAEMFDFNKDTEDVFTKAKNIKKLPENEPNNIKTQKSAD